MGDVFTVLFQLFAFVYLIQDIHMNSIRVNNILSFLNPLGILGLFLILTINYSCDTRPDEVYVIEATNVRIVDIKAHKVLIEGTLWYGNPTDQDGTHMSQSMEVDINGLHFDRINSHFSLETDFGPGKKWEAPFQINLRNEKLWDEATITDIMNHKVNKKMRIKGTVVGTVIMGINNPVEKKVYYELDETFTIFPEDKVPLK